MEIKIYKMIYTKNLSKKLEEKLIYFIDEKLKEETKSNNIRNLLTIL